MSIKDQLITDEGRIGMAAKELCRVAVTEAIYGPDKKKLASNCPFIFFDAKSKSYIIGDAYFNFSKTAFDFTIDWYQTPEIAEAMGIVDKVIALQTEEMVYICDKNTFNLLAQQNGSSGELKEGSLLQKLTRPAGTMNFLPASKAIHSYFEQAGATAITR